MKKIVVARSWSDVEVAVDQLIRSRRSGSTRSAYRDDWHKWHAFVVANGGDLKAPGRAAARRFRDELARQYAPTSVVRILSSLSFFYAALGDAGLVRTNPFAKTSLPRPEVSGRHRTPAVGDDAVARLEDAIIRDAARRGKRDLAIVRLLCETGLRRASLAALRRDQLRQATGELAAIVAAEGGKQRSVEITKRGQAALREWLEVAPPSPYVFPQDKDPTKHLSLTTFNKILAARSQQAGLSGAATPRQFRAAFITTPRRSTARARSKRRPGL